MYSGDISGLHFNLCGYFLSATARSRSRHPIKPKNVKSRDDIV
jgi:hypothetical protein